MAMRFSTINFKKRADAPALTQLSSIDAPCAEAACGPRAAPAAAESFARVGVLEARRRMEHEGWKPFVLDVRTRAEAQIVSLPFVDLQQPHRKVLKVAAQLPAEGRDILVHCKSGVRSAAACHALAAHGLSRLYNLDGGILGWARQVDPTMPTY
jgi:adenylyltransferase/sulfurtransferase